MKTNLVIAVYLLAVNIAGFAAMGIDKQRARKRAYRIPEATLFSIAVLGGSVGSIIGMYFFRHKTRHLKFVIGMPLILIIQIALIIFISLNPFFSVKVM